MTALIDHFGSRLGRVLGGMAFADEPAGNDPSEGCELNLEGHRCPDGLKRP
jgi:hypothetical protein